MLLFVVCLLLTEYIYIYTQHIIIIHNIICIFPVAGMKREWSVFEIKKKRLFVLYCCGSAYPLPFACHLHLITPSRLLFVLMIMRVPLEDRLGRFLIAGARPTGGEWVHTNGSPFYFFIFSAFSLDFPVVLHFYCIFVAVLFSLWARKVHPWFVTE